MTAIQINKPAGVLSSVTKGRLDKPPRIVIYGAPKVGKSSLAAGAPSPLFLTSEVGTDQLDISRVAITGWPQFLEVVEALISDPHDYRTVVIDTLDHLEAVLHKHIIATDPKGETSIVTVHGGYGKGFKVAMESFRKLADRLDVLTEKRKMTVLLLAHAHVRKFQDPESDGWDQYRLKMNEEAAGFWKEWSDALLFANLDIATRTDDNEKTRAIGTGERYLYTVPPRNAAYEAGNRYALPAKVPLRWSSLSDSIAASSRLRMELSGLLPKLQHEVSVRAAESARVAKDYDALDAVVKKVRELAMRTQEPVANASK